MSKSPKHIPTDRDDLLASEFALGVLNGEELSKVKMRIDSDLKFRTLVDNWQQRLSPMLDEVTEVTPPTQVWNKLENRLFGESVQGSNNGWLSSLPFWRGLSFASTALATLLLSIIILKPSLLLPTPAPTQNLVAALNLAEDKPTFVIQMNKLSGTISVCSANFSDENARVPELWLIPEDGVPRSLGVVSGNENSELTVDQSLQSLFKSGATLAVSLEPIGGAPDGKPTGPIVAAGKLLGI